MHCLYLFLFEINVYERLQFVVVTVGRDFSCRKTCIFREIHFEKHFPSSLAEAGWTKYAILSLLREPVLRWATGRATEELG
jgi:hypothetical protein